MSALPPCHLPDLLHELFRQREVQRILRSCFSNRDPHDHLHATTARQRRAALAFQLPHSTINSLTSVSWVFPSNVRTTCRHVNPQLVGRSRRQWHSRRLPHTCEEACEARVDVLRDIGPIETGACSEAPAGEAQRRPQSDPGVHACGRRRGQGHVVKDEEGRFRHPFTNNLDTLATGAPSRTADAPRSLTASPPWAPVATRQTYPDAMHVGINVLSPTRMNTYNVRQFANLIGVSVSTLHRWDRQGRLKPQRTPGNRRLYTEEYLALAGRSS